MGCSLGPQNLGMGLPRLTVWDSVSQVFFGKLEGCCRTAVFLMAFRRITSGETMCVKVLWKYGRGGATATADEIEDHIPSSSMSPAFVQGSDGFVEWLLWYLGQVCGFSSTSHLDFTLVAFWPCQPCGFNSNYLLWGFPNTLPMCLYAGCHWSSLTASFSSLCISNIFWYICWWIKFP